MVERTGIRVQRIQDVQRSFKKLGKTAKESRTAINKALRPAANMLARGIQKAYKKEFNKNSDYKRLVVEHQLGKRLV